MSGAADTGSGGGAGDGGGGGSRPSVPDGWRRWIVGVVLLAALLTIGPWMWRQYAYARLMGRLDGMMRALQEGDASTESAGAMRRLASEVGAEWLPVLVKELVRPDTAVERRAAWVRASYPQVPDGLLPRSDVERRLRAFSGVMLAGAGAPDLAAGEIAAVAPSAEADACGYLLIALSALAGLDSEKPDPGRLAILLATAVRIAARPEVEARREAASLLAALEEKKWLDGAARKALEALRGDQVSVVREAATRVPEDQN